MDSTAEVSNSLLNPFTPRQPTSLRNEAARSGNTGLWDVRDNSDTPNSPIIIRGSNADSQLEDNVRDDLLSKCSSQPSILRELNTLRIKSNRGRPRKKPTHKKNKSFKISKRKRKGNGGGLPIIQPQAQERDEAKAIFETGVLMGLLPQEDEEKSLELIKGNLLLN